MVDFCAGIQLMHIRQPSSIYLVDQVDAISLPRLTVHFPLEERVATRCRFRAVFATGLVKYLISAFDWLCHRLLDVVKFLSFFPVVKTHHRGHLPSSSPFSFSPSGFHRVNLMPDGPSSCDLLPFRRGVPKFVSVKIRRLLNQSSISSARCGLAKVLPATAPSYPCATAVCP